MKKLFLFAAALFSLAHFVSAQNTSPFWSTAGNNNAGITSKLGTTNGIPLRLFTNNTQRMVIDANGNIGIGTTSAKAKLHVSDQTAVTSFTGLSNAGLRIQGLNSPGNYALLGFSGYSNSYAGNLAQIGAIFSNSGSSLSFGTSDNYLNGITNTAMTINNKGNVGIGITNPIAKLQVEGTLGISQNGATSGSIYGSAKNLNINAAKATLSTEPGNLILQTGTTGPNGLAAGNVGIGTANPTYKLSVKGTIGAEEILVQAIWADYVFEKDYPLSPLTNIEKYIQQNKHLPGIPSAKQIQENGLAVGEIQTKMMEKIEELTLYLIEQNKQIQQLKAKVEQLEKE